MSVMFTKCCTYIVWSSMYRMPQTGKGQILILLQVCIQGRTEIDENCRLTFTPNPCTLQIWCQWISFLTDFRWHLGSCTSECLPTRRGFDEFKGIIEGQADYFNWRKLYLIGSYSRSTTLSCSIFFIMGSLSSHTKCTNKCPTIWNRSYM